MFCEKCNKNEATTFIKQNINGKKTEMHLCADCAKEMGMDNLFEPFSIDSFFGNFLGASNAALNSIAGIERCASCGSSFNDIVRSGRVGCADCYDKFFDKLEPSIRKLHGNIKHVGKNVTYTEEQEPKEEKSELDKLKDELKQAVKNQEFEQAAVIRDKIKELEENNG